MSSASFPIAIPARGSLLAGRVYRRTDDLFERQPAVVITGSWLTVKEQMADVYATALADLGYTAVTFDFSGWGKAAVNCGRPSFRAVRCRHRRRD